MLDIVLQIESFCLKNHIDHRFVGGVSFAGLLDKKTTWEINIKKKTITLKNYKDLQLFREDGTIRDIDIITFCNDLSKMNAFKRYISILKKDNNSFPSISIESAVYDHGKKNLIPQFVTAIEIDKDNTPYFAFDNLKQKISWLSLEPWKIILSDKIAYTTRNPIADYFAYHLRLPSGIKPKDKTKLILFKKLVDDVLQKGKKEKINYLSDEYYSPWKKYIDTLRTSPKQSIRIKKTLLHLYWNTFGTRLAHEQGFFGKLFSPLSNQFTGAKH